MDRRVARTQKDLIQSRRGALCWSVARLVACPHCNVHFKLVEPSCPHCGAGLPSDRSGIAATAGAVLLGLALGGCTSTEPPPKPKTPPVDVKKEEPKADPVHEPEAEYGVPVHDMDPAAPAYGMAEPLPKTDDEKKADEKKADDDAKKPG